jgi:hypothetical protein
VTDPRDVVGQAGEFAQQLLLAAIEIPRNGDIDMHEQVTASTPA